MVKRFRMSKSILVIEGDWNSILNIRWNILLRRFYISDRYGLNSPNMLMGTWTVMLYLDSVFINSVYRYKVWYPEFRLIGYTLDKLMVSSYLKEDAYTGILLLEAVP